MYCSASVARPYFTLHSLFSLDSIVSSLRTLCILARCTIHVLKGALRYRRSLRSTWGAIGSRLNSTLSKQNRELKTTLDTFPRLSNKRFHFPSLSASPSPLLTTLNSSRDSPSLPDFPLPPLCTTSFRSLLLPNLIFLLPSSLAADSFRSFCIPTPFPCLRIEYSPRYLGTSRSRFLHLLYLALKLSQKGQAGRLEWNGSDRGGR